MPRLESIGVTTKVRAARYRGYVQFPLKTLGTEALNGCRSNDRWGLYYGSLWLAPLFGMSSATMEAEAICAGSIKSVISVEICDICRHDVIRGLEISMKEAIVQT